MAITNHYVDPRLIPCFVGYSPDGFPGVLSGSNGNTPTVGLAKNIMRNTLLQGGNLHDTHMHAIFSRKVTSFDKWNEPTDEEIKTQVDAEESRWVSAILRVNILIWEISNFTRHSDNWRVAR